MRDPLTPGGSWRLPVSANPHVGSLAIHSAPDTRRPSPPPRGQDPITTAVTSHAIDAPSSTTLVALGKQALNDLRGICQDTRARIRAPAPDRLRTGSQKTPPAQERTPFNGPHDYALRRPVAPLSQLAYLRWNARPGGQTCRAQHCSSGWKEGKYAKPRKASPKYGGISIHLLSYLTNPGRNLGVSGRARRQIRAQATASFGYHRNRFSSCVPQYLPRKGEDVETKRVTTPFMYPEDSAPEASSTHAG